MLVVNFPQPTLTVDYLVKMRASILNLLDAAIILKLETVSLSFPPLDQKLSRIIAFYVAYACNLPRWQLGQLKQINLVS